MGVGRALVLFLSSPLKGALFTGPLIPPGTFSYIWLQLEALVCKRNLLLHIQSSHPPFPLSPASPRAWVTSPEELLLPHAPFWPGLGQDPCFSYDLGTTWDETSAPFAPPSQQFKGSLGLMAPSCSGLALGTDQDSWLRNLPGAPAHLLWLISFHLFQP